MAEDFFIEFEGRLWTQGDNHSLSSLLDIASMGSSGALLNNSMERILRLISQMSVCTSSPRRETSITSEVPSFTIEPTSAADPTSHTATKIGSRHVLFGPQQSDDDLRASGRVIALACDKDLRRWTELQVISRWICEVSLAADEDSVSTSDTLRRANC